MPRRDAVWIFASISVALGSIPTIFILYYGFIVFHNSIGFSSTVLLSILLTLLSSAVAAFIVFIVFTPLAYELSRSRHPIWESVSDVPASIPHPIVGIAFLLIGSPLTPVGAFLSRIGLGLFDTFQGLIIALSFIAMPIYVRSAQSVFASLPRDPENFALSMGMSRFRALYSVLVAGSFREIVSAGLTSMSRAMSEFGSIAILTYYVLQYPFNGIQPASVLIYKYFGYFGPGVAVTASAFMILFSFAIIAAIRLLNWKTRGKPSREEGVVR